MRRRRKLIVYPVTPVWNIEEYPMPDAQHDLKCYPLYYRDVRAGVKTFEIRKCDRPFKIGDTIRLLEYDSGAEDYTGQEMFVKVTYILKGKTVGIQDGFCILGIEVLE